MLQHLAVELAPFLGIAGEDGEHRLTLQYTVETGENTYTVYSFTTLSIEEVTLELLSPDAITGATPFRFVLDQQ